MAGEDLGGRLRRGIDRLIGVAAGKRERRDRENDGKPHGRFPTLGRPAAARARGRRGGELGHQVPVRFPQAIGQPIGGACWRRRHWRLWRPARVQASPLRKLSLGHVFPIAFAMLSRREHFKENFHAAWASNSSNSPEAMRESENDKQSLPSNRNQSYTASCRRTRNGSRADAARARKDISLW